MGLRPRRRVFFAGHGLHVGGRNYLVPSDFKVPNKNYKLEPMLRDTALACIGLDLVEEDSAGRQRPWAALTAPRRAISCWGDAVQVAAASTAGAAV